MSLREGSQENVLEADLYFKGQICWVSISSAHAKMEYLHMCIFSVVVLYALGLVYNK